MIKTIIWDNDKNEIPKSFNQQNPEYLVLLLSWT